MVLVASNCRQQAHPGRDKETGIGLGGRHSSRLGGKVFKSQWANADTPISIDHLNEYVGLVLPPSSMRLLPRLLIFWMIG